MIYTNVANPPCSLAANGCSLGRPLPAAAVEETEHHERQLDYKFQDKPKYGREENHGQFKYGKVGPGLGDRIPEMYKLALHFFAYYAPVAMVILTTSKPW